MLFKRETDKENCAREAIDISKSQKNNLLFVVIFFAGGLILFTVGMLNLGQHLGLASISVFVGLIYVVVGALLWDRPRRWLEKRKEKELAGIMIEARSKKPPPAGAASPPIDYESDGSKIE